MTRSELKEIKGLVKSFNDKNKVVSRHYEITTEKYARGRYSCKIIYSIFFSLDMTDMMTYCLDHKLLVRLGSYDGGQTYMDIQ